MFIGNDILLNELNLLLDGSTGIDSISFHNLNKNNSNFKLYFKNLLRIRIIQYNINVFSKYYSLITIPRMCGLMKLEPKELEEQLAYLSINNGKL